MAKRGRKAFGNAIRRQYKWMKKFERSLTDDRLAEATQNIIAIREHVEDGDSRRFRNRY